MINVRGLQFDPSALVDGNLTPDILWGRDCLAFNIQADLCDQAVAAIGRIQRAFDARIPHQHVIPAHALHLSVLNVVHVRGPHPPRRKAALWAEKESTWLPAIDAEAAVTPPFELVLERIVPSPSGLLVAAVDSAELVDLRQRLAVALGGLEVRPLPELCHVTVVRYGTDLPSQRDVHAFAEQERLRVVIRVARLRTVREVVYPSLRRETIRRHPLGGSVDDRSSGPADTEGA